MKFSSLIVIRVIGIWTKQWKDNQTRASIQIQVGGLTVIIPFTLFYLFFLETFSRVLFSWRANWNKFSSIKQRVTVSFDASVGFSLLDSAPIPIWRAKYSILTIILATITAPWSRRWLIRQSEKIHTLTGCFNVWNAHKLNFASCVAFFLVQYGRHANKC